MAELFTSRWIGDFLFAFGALFAIINPYGLAFIFLDRTMGLSNSERARVALRVALYAFAVMLGSLFVGSQVLKVFGPDHAHRRDRARTHDPGRREMSGTTRVPQRLSSSASR